MRKYELTVIFRPEEENYSRGKEFVKSELDKASVEVKSDEDLKNRQLAYEIKKEARGHYHFYQISANPDQISAIEKQFMLKNEILKFLFVRSEN